MVSSLFNMAFNAVVSNVRCDMTTNGVDGVRNGLGLPNKFKKDIIERILETTEDNDVLFLHLCGEKNIFDDDRNQTLFTRLVDDLYTPPLLRQTNELQKTIFDVSHFMVFDDGGHSDAYNQLKMDLHNNVWLTIQLTVEQHVLLIGNAVRNKGEFSLKNNYVNNSD